MSINVETLAAANAYTAASLKGAGALQGRPGKDGPEGKSAYQVALDNGFVGTEAQWLASLVGSGMTPERLLDSLKGAASEWEWKNQSLTSSGSVSDTTIRLFSYIPESVTNIIPQQNVIQRICGWDADGIYLGEFENYQFVKKIAEMSIPFNPQPLRNTYPGIKLAVIIGYAKDASGNADSVSVEDINSLVEFEYAKGTSITEDIKRLNKIIGTMTPGNILRFTADYEHITHAVTMSVEDVSTLCLNGTTDGVAFIGLNGVTDSGGSRLKWLEPGAYKLTVDLVSGTAKYKPKFMLSSSKEVTLDQPFVISDPSTMYVRLEKAWTFTSAKFRCVLEPLDTEEIDADATAVDAYARKKLAELTNSISAEDEIQRARAQKLLHPCRMKFLAHRGYKKKAIENTVYAYELAGKYGFDFVNVAQCRQSADGTWWAIHNATTDAISGGAVTGAVADKTDAELAAILSAEKWTVSGMSNVVDYASVKDFTDDQRKIAKVEEIIRICLRYDMGIMLRLGSLPEVINTEADRASWDSFVGLCKKYAIQDSALFSGTIAQLTIMRQYNPNAQISMYGFGAAGAVANAASHGWTENVWLGIDEFTPADIETLHKAGIKVCAGASVATKEELAEMAALGVEIASSQFNIYI